MSTSYDLNSLHPRAAEYFRACAIPMRYPASEDGPAGVDIPIVGQGVVMHPEHGLWPYYLRDNGTLPSEDIIGYVVIVTQDQILVRQAVPHNHGPAGAGSRPTPSIAKAQLAPCCAPKAVRS